MNPKGDISKSSNQSVDEIAKERRRIYEQINHIKKMKQHFRPEPFRPPSAQLKDPPKPQKPSKINISLEQEPTSLPLIEKETAKEQVTQLAIPDPIPKIQEPINKNSQDLKIQEPIIQKPQQTQVIVEETKTSLKADEITPKTPEKEQSFKRNLDQIISSEEVQKQVQNIDQQRKIQSHVRSDTHNESTCIEISSSSEDQESQKQDRVQPKNQNFKAKSIKVPIKIQQKFSETYQTSIKSLFSNFKLSYVMVNDQILVRYRKEKKRLQMEGKQLKLSESKIKLPVSHISVSKTIPIQFISERIIRKDCISDEVRNLRFWFFRGTPKDFEGTLIQTVKSQGAYIESKKLVSLKNLYEWYTLAHLLSFSTNIVIVVEKRTANVLIRNVHPTKCSSCRNPIHETCLCMRYQHPRKPCCQDAARNAMKHQYFCKFSNEYRPKYIKADIDSSSKRGVVGLVNCQNSCFMNTALQCLASCEPLTEYFLGKEYIKNINYGNHLGTFGELATRYAQFLKETYTSTKPSLELEAFKKSLYRWDNKYIRDEQQDSQEFLTQLLDWLKEDLNLNNNRAQYVQDQENECLSMEEKAQVAWKRHLSRNNSIIEYLMAGIIRSGIQCQQCLYESHKFETFLTLPLPLTQSQTKGRQTLQVKVFLVYSNFRRKNQTAVITLESFKYEDALKEINKTFDLSENSVLIGLSCITQGSSRIQTATQGSVAIKRTAQNPEAKLIFLEHTKSQIQGQNIEVCFLIKTKPKTNNEVPASFKRYLYFSRKEGSTAFTLFKKLLLYFYSVMFKNSNQISPEQYLKKYLNPQNIPFKVLLRNSKVQITMDQQISFDNKADIFVSIQSQEDFVTRHFFTALHLNKEKLDENSFHQKSPKGSMISINDCFEEFEKTDVMEEGNSWNCPKCKQKRKAFKKMCIYKAPKILILFFKRFQSEHDGRYHTMRKIETFVEFPHLLDLKNYVQKEEMPYTSQKCELKYRLFAVANHLNLSSGGGQIGHYLAFINQSNNWFKINDERISPIGQGEVCTRNAYMLFYSRQEAQ